jgi:hypothetical protein
MSSSFRIVNLEIEEAVNQQKLNTFPPYRNIGIINLQTTEIINQSNLNNFPRSQLSFVVNNILLNEALVQINLTGRTIKSVIGYTSTTYATIQIPAPEVYGYWFYKTPTQSYLEFDNPLNKENVITVPKNAYITKISLQKYSNSQPDFAYPEDGVCRPIVSDYPEPQTTFAYHIYMKNDPNNPSHFTEFNGAGNTGIMIDVSVVPAVEVNIIPDVGYFSLSTQGFTKEDGTPSQVMITVEYYE